MWVPETGRAYCDYHKEERGELKPIDRISTRMFDEIWARQRAERRQDEAK